MMRDDFGLRVTAFVVTLCLTAICCVKAEIVCICTGGSGRVRADLRTGEVRATESTEFLQTSPFVYTNGGEYVCWYKIEAPNYKPFVHQAKLKIIQQVEIVNITAQQRYPWNGLVDLSFTITGNSGMTYDTSFSVKDISGGTNLLMQTLMDANGSVLSLTNSLAPGPYKWIWNAAKDLPSGFVCDRLIVNANVVDRSLPSVTAGLVAYWPFHGDALDKSGNGFHLSGGDIAWIPDHKGQEGNAVSFSGGDLKLSRSLGVTNSMTFAGWFYPTANSDSYWPNYDWTTGGHVHIGRGNFGLSWHGWPMIISPNESKSVGLAIGTKRINVFQNAGNFDCLVSYINGDMDGQWSYIVVTIDNRGAPVLYLNGVRVSGNATSFVDSPLFVSETLGIGGGSFSHAGMWYTGGVEELCIFNRALSADEVQRLCNGSK